MYGAEKIQVFFSLANKVKGIFSYRFCCSYTSDSNNISFSFFQVGNNQMAQQEDGSCISAHCLLILFNTFGIFDVCKTANTSIIYKDIQLAKFFDCGVDNATSVRVACHIGDKGQNLEIFSWEILNSLVIMFLALALLGEA